MNYKKAFITGGAGLIGSHIADQLVAQGFEDIVILDNLTRGRMENLEPALASGKVRVVEGDIRDAALVQRTMEGMPRSSSIRRRFASRTARKTRAWRTTFSRPGPSTFLKPQ